MTGIACVGNGQVLLSAEIKHRRDVKEKRNHLQPYPEIANCWSEKKPSSGRKYRKTLETAREYYILKY
jgi:hypothetical protein